MTLELVTCPYCGYSYSTNIEEIVKDGETDTVRSFFSDKNYFSGKVTTSFFIDLKCPNSPDCGKTFKWEVKT